MPGFCATCGSALDETSVFCGACGARIQPAAVPLAASPVSALPPMTPLAPARTGSSPLLKIILVVVVLLLLAGSVTLAGIFYAVHLAARKAHEFSRQVRDGGIIATLPADDDTGIAVPGACRLLSKEDVGRAIGIAIVATKTTANGCEYLAQGTAGEMTAKHVAAMMASNGASDQQQQMMQSLSRGLLGAGQADESSPNPDVHSVVMSFVIKPNGSQFKMDANEHELSGVGDEAFAVAGSVLVVRKGNKLIRITYSSCPCTTTAIIPLAKRLAASQ